MMMRGRNTHRRGSAARAAAWAAAALVVAALAGAGGCKSAMPTTKPKPRNVAVQVIEPIAALRDTFRIVGQTEPGRTVKVIAEVAGRIEELAVSEGQTVYGDDGDDASLIVRLNTDLLQATFDLCRADAEFTKLEADKLEEMLDSGVATQHEWDRARTQYLIAKARQDSAAAELERSKICAPISGVLNSLPVEHGEYLQPGTLVAEIVDVDTVKVVLPVPELDVSYLSVGDEATVVARLRGRDEEFKGQITYISKLSDPGTFTSRVEITIDNADGRLLTGKMVDVRLTRRVIADAIMVPLDAVIRRQHDRVVYVVSSDVELAFDVPSSAADSLAEGDEGTVDFMARYETHTRAEITEIEKPEGQDIVRLHIRFRSENANWLGTSGRSAGWPLHISLPGQFGVSVVVGPVESDETNAEQPDDAQPARIVAELSRFAERREVELGIIRGNEVQILSGLAAGDMLIVEGQQYVGPGQAVRIVPSVEARTAQAADDAPTDRQQQ